MRGKKVRMEQFYIFEDWKAKIEMKQVLKWMDCTPDSSAYEDFVEEYRELEKEFAGLLRPMGILGFGKLSEQTGNGKYSPGTPVLYAVMTVGGDISRASTKAFADGDYVRGMLLDSIADVALFSLEENLQAGLKAVCAKHKVGIEKRLEAPQDIPMEVQREAWETLHLKERLGVDISSGFMFDPLKTTCQVFVLTERAEVFQSQHDCRNCSNTTCKLRRIPEVEVSVRHQEETKCFTLKPDETLMDGLLRNGFYISAVCGGGGRCGKCKIKVLKGNAPVTSGDAKFFSESELKEGWRLSCLLVPQSDLTIAFDLKDEAEFEAVSGFAQPMIDRKQQEEEKASCSIAIDIGTTTLAFQLLTGDGALLSTETLVNSQRKYGADVISRMQASVNGKKKELQECIRRDLQAGITALFQNCRKSLAEVKRVAIACNTTMSHLLMGYSCDGLGVYPFTPVNIGFIRGSVSDIIGLPSEAEVVVLPGISTFVGGDIVSGLYACDVSNASEISLLVDLGTNGEMALGNKERILVTSTAAGPAFEGGNITWGMGSVAGAICSVRVSDVKTEAGYFDTDGGLWISTRTIRDKAPVGICGTGVVEAIAELLREEVIDEMGLLDEDYFEDGFPLADTENGEKIVLTQKDIRELQLAKAAIRAGIETLLLRYGISKEQVGRVYLAGGFGYRLDVEKAVAIGMLPEEFADRIVAVGNASLAGATKYLFQGCHTEELQNIVKRSEEIGLSMDKDFNEIYMDSMLFE